MKLRIFQRAAEESPLWLIIFSDMSTNLMLFFLMLFAMTRMSAAEKEMLIEGMEKATANEEAIQMRLLKKEKEASAVRMLENAIAHGRLKQYANLEVNDDKIKLTLEMPVFFASGSAEIHYEALRALESLVIPLGEFPDDIVIEGHTDNVPISGGMYRSNWELSVARSVSVINYFTSKGLSSEQLVAGGYGEYHPVAPNDTEAGRSRNRRIEITIIRLPKT